MSELSKQIIKTAQSEMCRNALSHWTKFRLPEANEDIEALIAKLEKSARSQPYEIDKSTKSAHRRRRPGAVD